MWRRGSTALRLAGYLAAAALAASPVLAIPAGDARTQSFKLQSDGMRLYKEGNYRAATEAFQQVVSIHLNSFLAYYYLGASLIAERRYAEAIDPLKVALELSHPAHFTATELRYAIYAPAPSTLHFEVEVPESAVLSFGYGLTPAAHARAARAPLSFEVEATTGEGATVALPRALARPQDRLLLPRLVEPVQAHRGGLLPPGRGVRPRSVPHLQAAGDHEGGVRQARGRQRAAEETNNERRPAQARTCGQRLSRWGFGPAGGSAA